jgi:hypothetical protein
MFIFTKLSSSIRWCDNYGTDVVLNFIGDSNKHKSWIGGISTIILLIGVVTFASNKLKEISNAENTTFSSNFEPADPRELYCPDLK